MICSVRIFPLTADDGDRGPRRSRLGRLQPHARTLHYVLECMYYIHMYVHEVHMYLYEYILPAHNHNTLA